MWLPLMYIPSSLCHQLRRLKGKASYRFPFREETSSHIPSTLKRNHTTLNKASKNQATKQWHNKSNCLRHRVLIQNSSKRGAISIPHFSINAKVPQTYSITVHLHMFHWNGAKYRSVSKKYYNYKCPDTHKPYNAHRHWIQYKKLRISAAFYENVKFT